MREMQQPTEGLYQKIIAFGTIILGLVGIGSLVLTYCALQDTKKATAIAMTQARTARQELEMSHRPWVLFTGDMKVDKLLAPGVTPVFTLSFKNFGRGMAKHIWPYYGIGLDPLDPGCKEIKKAEFGWHAFPQMWKEKLGIMAPDATYFLEYAKSVFRPLTADDVIKLSSGSLSLCVFGFISYEDELSYPHGTRYCIRYNLTMPDNTYDWCPNYNDAW